MKHSKIFLLMALLQINVAFAQNKSITLVKNDKAKKVDILADGKPFTSFLYPDTIEKPFLYPVYTANQTVVTRGFPFNKREGEPTDHPHHMGLWFNFENVNGLDFWNNSYAIPAEKKNKYGWIKNTKVIKTQNGPNGTLSYQSDWANQQNEVLLKEQTTLTFSANGNNRIVDRTTTLTANQEVNFNDAKDGMLGFRLAHELQIPATKDEKYTDDKGIVTVVKKTNDKIATGNYIASNGKTGDDVWSTRGNWCKVYGKMGTDSVSVTIIDHPKNINYPTYWHARGYGLFAANPLGAKAFTNGKSVSNLKLQKGESVTFKYRVVIQNGKTALPTKEIETLAAQFVKQ